MATFNIPPFNVQVGVQVIGPFTIPKGWHQVDFEIDGAAQVGVIDLVFEYSSDGGNTWATLWHCDYTGPALDKDGVSLITTIDGHMGLPFRVPGLNPAMRATITSTGAWHSTGGQLVVT